MVDNERWFIFILELVVGVMFGVRVVDEIVGLVGWFFGFFLCDGSEVE